jgi:hypothetical protein
VADVLKHLEACREVFELLADLGANPMSLVAAGRAGLLGV